MLTHRKKVQCPQGPDLASTKPTRDDTKVIHDSFRKIRSRLREEGLQHIAEDLSFTSFTTLDPDRFFGGMRTPSRPTPDMYDYATRRRYITLLTPQKGPAASLSLWKRTISLHSCFIQAPRVTTYNGECTRKSPNGCTSGHRSTEMNVQRERGTQTHQDRDKLRSEARDL